MTHDELLELINRKNHSQGMVIHVDTFRDVLRAVVELHTPDVDGACPCILAELETYGDDGLPKYPCPTIQAIEEKLQ